MSESGALPEIRLLRAELRDQIAAGEVVERPASVVKELVENALDAGARTVRIEIDGGGLQRIAVIDDGHGMLREGALLALERHATSKVEVFEDLYRLSTFGFRGEALPSIASVSRFTLVTRPADALSATEVVVVAGERPQVREVGAPSGTSIEVKDLFFNVPARRKFLKSVGTEAGHVGEVCLELALSRHDVALTLVRDGRVARQYLRVPDRGARARESIGRSGSESKSNGPDLAHASGERARLKVEAFLSAPERARSGATGLHLLVNGRSVRDRALSRAVAMAYGSVLDPGRYPVGVVYIEVPPEDVDVNVHPQKAEVRFSRGRELYDDVTRALGASLAHSFRAPSSAVSFLDSGKVSDLFPTAAPPTVTGHATFAPDTDPWGLDGDAVTLQRDGAGIELSRHAQSAPPLGREARQAQTLQESMIGWNDQPAPSLPRMTTLASADAPTAAQLHEAARELRGEGRYGSLRFLVQVRATYLVCEGPEALFVIDQHAAAERVNFFRLRTAHQKHAVPRQQLLVPEIVVVSSSESALVDEARDEMLALGIDAHAIGDGRVSVQGVPALLSKATPGTLLRDLIDELARTGDRKFGDAADLVLATMACHGSVRAGDVMHPDECTALLKALDEVDFAGYCPHGRPIVTVLSYAELEKKVGRR